MNAIVQLLISLYFRSRFREISGCGIVYCGYLLTPLASNLEGYQIDEGEQDGSRGPTSTVERELFTEMT